MKPEQQQRAYQNAIAKLQGKNLCPKCVSSTIMYCPWCEEAIEPVMEGHDEFSTQWRCPKCGHRWEEW